MTSVPMGDMGRILHESKFWEIFAEFQCWRLDPYIRQLESKKSKGRVLPFVRGLRLSARLIYLIRTVLSGSGLTANWGHLLDIKENFCSSECDVIIHKEGHVLEWDGGDQPVMNFKFIKQENAVVVISCKSYLLPSNIDKEYCQSLNTFVNKVWLFAECCKPDSIGTISSRSKEYGYENFWTLYTWTKEAGATPNKEGWIDFVKKVKYLRLELK